MSYDSKLNTSVFNIIIRTISTFYKKRSKLKNIETGSVTVIQRFGGALNLNTHFHILFMDGVYDVKNNFHEVIPCHDDIVKLVQTLCVVSPCGTDLVT